MDRNSRTPRLVQYYRPATPMVWLQALLLLAGAAGIAVIYLLLIR